MKMPSFMAFSLQMSSRSWTGSLDLPHCGGHLNKGHCTRLFEGGWVLKIWYIGIFCTKVPQIGSVDSLENELGLHHHLPLSEGP
jgi:hypothetical protein